MKTLKLTIENYAFGVCSFLGNKMGIPSRYIRLFFIYTSFVSISSPVIVYLILAFWINMKNYLLEGRKRIAD